MAQIIRKPCGAGSFYPAEASELKRLVEQFLANTGQKAAIHLPCVLIVPHAGYHYSGQVAAYGYAAIAAPERVLLLGASHYFPVDDLATYDGDEWQTALGNVDLDRKTIAALSQSALIYADNAVHQPEHALEVQLPFLQCIAPNTKIVPLLMSSVSWHQIRSISKLLSDYCDEKTLLLVSSDLSHFPNGAMAEKIDYETIEAILSGDVQYFYELVDFKQGQKADGLSTRACGAIAIAVGMLVAQNLGLKQAQKLAYAHSGQISGDMSRVVGYTSICFWN